MTDSEIIREATEVFEKNSGAGCYVGDLLRIINRQQAEIDILIRKKETLRDEVAELQAEIERLREENTALDGANVLLTVTLQNARAEAIKEFAERLKENEIDIDVSYGFGREHYTKAVATIVIDNLVKELTEVIEDA